MCKKSDKEEKINKIKVTSLDIIVTMHRDKPYYEIKYKEAGENFYHIGYSSYDLNIILNYKKTYFELIVCESDNDIPAVFDIDTVMESLNKELKLADDEKSRCIKENPMQFDEAKGYARGVAIAIEIVKGGMKNEDD